MDSKCIYLFKDKDGFGRKAIGAKSFFQQEKNGLILHNARSKDLI